jgi:hypothetical protein
MGTITNTNSLALALGFSRQPVKCLFIRRTATGLSSVVITKNELGVWRFVSPTKLATFSLCSSALDYSDGKWKLLNLLLFQLGNQQEKTTL